MIIEVDKKELLAALIELQAASWSRSWKRVKIARSEIYRLTGLEITGPLKHLLTSDT